MLRVLRLDRCAAASSLSGGVIEKLKGQGCEVQLETDPAARAAAHGSGDRLDAEAAKAKEEADNELSAAKVLAELEAESGVFKYRSTYQTFLDSEPDPITHSGAHARWRLGVRMESAEMRGYFLIPIVVNALLMSVQIDNDPHAQGWEIAETCFVAFFMFELALKMIGFGVHFWKEGWNLLDFAIVFCSTAEVVAYWSSGDAAFPKITVLRLMRVFRTVRVFSNFERLALLLKAFFMACKDMIWVFLLIFLVIYMFSIMASGFFTDNKKLEECGFDVEAYFGTFPRTLISMFQVMMADGWHTIIRPIGEVHPGSQIFFISFIIIMSWGLLQFVTAIFVETITTMSHSGDAEKKKKKEIGRKILLSMMKDAFTKADQDNSGDLDANEMASVMQLFRLKAYQDALQMVDVDLEMMDIVMQNADTDQSGTIDYREFLASIETMHDHPKKCDTWVQTAKLKQMLAQSEAQTRKIKKMEQAMEAQAKQFEIQTKQLETLVTTMNRFVTTNDDFDNILRTN